MPISEVFNEDCMVGMARYPDKFFDLAIVDPPYGLREHGGKDRGKYALQPNGSYIWYPGGDYAKKDWDFKPPSPKYFDDLLRVSKHQIIWGCNYFNRYFGAGRIVWDKCNGASDQNDAEIAFNSLVDRVDLFRFMWSGFMQGKSVLEGHIMQGNKKLNEKRIHPTQKPVALYRWCLAEYARPGFKILDTHMGSQSSRIAAYDLNFDYYGFEIDQEYFADGDIRFKAETRQLSIFR